MDNIEETLKALRRVVSNNLYKRQRWCTADEGALLKHLVESVGAKSYIECGTANGYSTVWAVLGLSSGGRAYTFDQANHPKVYEDKELGCTSVATQITFIKDSFDALANNVGDLQHPLAVFIDGGHKHRDVVKDWNTILPFLEFGDVVIFHDLNIEGVKKAWDEIVEDTKSFDHSTFPTRNCIGAILIKQET